jgi:protein gp37
MAEHTAIEWTDSTWNPVTGCTKVSPGCKYCYAERLTERFGRRFTEIRFHPERLALPLRWRRPRRIFVNSMSDLFHEQVSEPFIQQVFAVMAEAHWHTFQVLTKRAERLAEVAARLAWPPNVWQGVSIENAAYVCRIRYLRRVPAAVRFLSVEPLLGPIPHLPLEGIDWVIVGGESGPRRRPLDPAWVRQIRDQCRAAGVPFFFKQWGGTTSKAGGRVLDDRLWDEMPADPRTREPSLV